MTVSWPRRVQEAIQNNFALFVGALISNSSPLLQSILGNRLGNHQGLPYPVHLVPLVLSFESHTGPLSCPAGSLLESPLLFKERDFFLNSPVVSLFFTHPIVIGAFVHSFIHVAIGHPLCARHCSRTWGLSNEEDMSLPSSSLCSHGGRQTLNKN